MRRLIKEIAAFLGEPAPMEIERKFLIVKPGLRALARRANCEPVDIIQTCLKTDGNTEEMRIRQHGADGHYNLLQNGKKKLSDLKRVEKEERLSRDEYLALLTQADPAYRPIHKKRYCLSENGLYYEIDIFPEWEDTARMEIELHSEDQLIVLPEDIEVIREVTGDPAYSNHQRTKIG